MIKLTVMNSIIIWLLIAPPAAFGQSHTINMKKKETDIQEEVVISAPGIEKVISTDSDHLHNNDYNIISEEIRMHFVSTHVPVYVNKLDNIIYVYYFNSRTNTKIMILNFCTYQQSRIMDQNEDNKKSPKSSKKTMTKKSSTKSLKMPSKSPDYASKGSKKKIKSCKSKKSSKGKGKEPSCASREIPSEIPRIAPSNKPSLIRSSLLSDAPSSSNKPSAILSSAPSSILAAFPSRIPSTKPSLIKSIGPSNTSSSKPSHPPSVNPSAKPSSMPSNIPSHYPSLFPSASSIPSTLPTIIPTCLADEVFGKTYYASMGSSSNCIKFEFFSGGVVSLDSNNLSCNEASFSPDITYSIFESISGSLVNFGAGPVGLTAGYTGTVSIRKHSSVSGLEAQIVSLDNTAKTVEVNLIFETCNSPSSKPSLLPSARPSI